MPQQTDAELIRLTLAGNQSAFAELVRRYQRRVAITIRSVVGDLPQEDLADIAQDVFLLIYKGLGSFRGEAQFGTWVTRIALRHCYRDAKRRRKKRSIFQYFESQADRNDTPEQRIPDTAKTDESIMAHERQSEPAA